MEITAERLSNMRFSMLITTNDRIRLKPDRWAGRVGLAEAPFTPPSLCD
jgi:hypothetical protein